MVFSDYYIYLIATNNNCWFIKLPYWTAEKTAGYGENVHD